MDERVLTRPRRLDVGCVESIFSFAPGETEYKSLRATIPQSQLCHRWERELGVTVPHPRQTWLGRVMPVRNSAALTAVFRSARHTSALCFRGATKAQVALIPVEWSNLRWKVQ